MVHYIPITIHSTLTLHCIPFHSCLHYITIYIATLYSTYIWHNISMHAYDASHTICIVPLCTMFHIQPCMYIVPHHIHAHMCIYTTKISCNTIPYHSYVHNTTLHYIHEHACMALYAITSGDTYISYTI